jgi:hypothetical protein
VADKTQRFSVETPAADAGWTVEQSRRNFDVVTKLINTATPETLSSCVHDAASPIRRFVSRVNRFFA